jgi:cation diffusion facilitator family transporter
VTTVERRCTPAAPAESFARNERRTALVVGLTLVMMVVELVVGYLTRSLALVADGWHMATHAGALGLAVLAYWYARTRARSHAFTFGTGKVHALAGFTSAALLAVAAVFVIVECLVRFVTPTEVATTEALIVAAVGLGFNLLCALILGDGHDHHHDHDHHDHPHEHAHDHNLRAARLHVLADALTSVLAIAALAAVRWLHWWWADPIAAFVGGFVILRWGWQLCRSTALQLLDASWSPETAGKLTAALEETGAEVTDLHLWELGPGQRGLIVSLVSATPLPLSAYRDKIAAVAKFSHVTVEIEPRGQALPPQAL